MIDKYVHTKDVKGIQFVHWDGELDEDKQFNDAIDLSVAIWDLVLPFLLTCDDPIGVLQTAMDFVVDDAVDRLPMEVWVENFSTKTPPEQTLRMLIDRTLFSRA